MKKFTLFLLIYLVCAFETSAQCPEPILQNFSKPLVTKDFQVTKQTADDDLILMLEASAKNSSWALKNSESVVLTVFVDGKYNQDILLFAGAEKFQYKVVLGKFPVGKHQLSVVFNRERSAQKSNEAKISAVKIKPFSSQNSIDKIAVAKSPFLFARPDTIDKFSDIPLLTYYEILPNGENSSKIRYTTIFSNEDGGTQTAALMARWGRVTDIEWVYEIEIKNREIVNEIYQGVNHLTTDFRGGQTFGDHPMIYNVTVNNNFSDHGCSALRMAQMPIKADLSTKSRETVMDENAWTYRIMAEEARREGRINPEKMDANTIADLRDYVFAEISANPSNAAIALEAKTADGKIYSSDDEKSVLRVDRQGFMRIALQLPRSVRNNSSLLFSIVCHQKTVEKGMGVCDNLNLVKIVTLNEKFYPLELKLKHKASVIKTGEKADFTVKF